jgi:dienelactone hydrolase
LQVGFAARRAGVAIVAALFVAAGVSAATAARAGFHSEQTAVWSAEQSVRMQVTLYVPAGRGPFPLAIINHGTSSNAEVRAGQDLAPYARIGRWFAERGYLAAIPQRPGHGETGGVWVEDYGSCQNPHYLEAGLAAAREVRAVLNALLGRHDVRRDRIVLVGHSAGGWASLALAALQPPGLAAVINFAGGLGGRSYDIPHRNCAPERLIAAAGQYGASARVPTLWIYARNDTYFDPALATAMAGAFVRAGGRADLRFIDGDSSDGHFILFDAAAEPKWTPLVERFLRLTPPQRKR